MPDKEVEQLDKLIDQLNKIIKGNANEISQTREIISGKFAPIPLSPNPVYEPKQDETKTTKQ